MKTLDLSGIAPFSAAEEAAERAYIAEYVTDPRLRRWIVALDAARSATPPADQIAALTRYGLTYDRNLLQVIGPMTDGKWLSRKDVLAALDAAHEASVAEFAELADAEASDAPLADLSVRQAIAALEEMRELADAEGLPDVPLAENMARAMAGDR